MNSTFAVAYDGGVSNASRFNLIDYVCLELARFSAAAVAAAACGVICSKRQHFVHTAVVLTNRDWMYCCNGLVHLPLDTRPRRT